MWGERYTNALLAVVPPTWMYLLALLKLTHVGVVPVTVSNDW
jgi:hypothetical protein